MGKTRRRTSRLFRQPTGLPEKTRVLQLAYFGRNSIGFDLSRALGAVQNAGRITAKVDENVREQLIWLRTKLDELMVVGARVSEEWSRVRDQAVAADPAHDGYALLVGRLEAVTLAADVESLITCLHATLDAMVALVVLVERAVLKPRVRTAQQLLRTLPGISPIELTLFKDARHGFAHHQAPWLAVVLVPQAQPDLAILTRWRPNYARGEGYLLLSQVVRWWRALEGHIAAQEHALALRLNELVAK